MTNSGETEQSASKKGVPAAINTAINRLKALCAHLPKSLPLDPPNTKLSFALDEEDVKEEGLAYAFNRQMEVAFAVHSLKSGANIVIAERGQRLDDLIRLFKSMAKLMTENDRAFYLVRWIERCTRAANDAGAKLPNSKKKRHASGNPALENDNGDPESSASRAKKPRLEPPQESIEILDSDDGELDETRTEASMACSTSTSLKPIAPRPILSPDTAPSLSLIPSSQGPVPTRQATLFDVGCRRTSMREAILVQKRVTERYGTSLEERKAKEARVKVEKQTHSQRLNRERQQAFRDRKKEAKLAERAANPGPLPLQPSKDAKEMEDIAMLSRQGGDGWRKERTGSKNGVVVEQKATRVNWYHPLLWVHINDIAARVNFSPSAIEHHLKLQNPALFSRINKGTVSRWISEDKKQWSEATLKNVARGKALAGTGRVGVLSKHPEVVLEIKRQLQQLRDSGIPKGLSAEQPELPHLPRDPEKSQSGSFTIFGNGMQRHRHCAKGLYGGRTLPSSAMP
ncbi:hypothetical protein DFP72DRAFT_842427 [Ephemerocybe angulata]|uniref:Uncharacterized protein n=1 Tax=Ephemerocybe angulata TaxID=980116 RepID=A0A8H6IC15_9AGAR|nr:hypothetical protein DFP72DRAFT_842427 [Tulosesus angulatus]